MILDFVESRVTNPVKLVDWGAVDESRGMVCACCGWSGRLGECDRAECGQARAYACSDCGMTLVVRAYPRVIPVRIVAAAEEWMVQDLLAANG